jgi:RNA polymerase sigma-70 factor (ECF subfamily)
VGRYIRQVHAIGASLLAEPADVEDAAQDTFLRALRAIDAYDVRRPFAPWLYQIARNVARNRAAHARRWRWSPIPPGMVAEQSDADLALERAEFHARIAAAIERLPERRRTAFYLCDIEGYAASEVAQMMGLDAGTVRSHVHYARAALRAVLDPSGEPVEYREEA